MMDIKPPALHKVASEGLSGFEFARLFASSPALAMQPRGNDDPVLVLPGYGASNGSTLLLRSYLTWLGYEVHGWQQGRNRGDVAGQLPLVQQHVRQLHRHYGRRLHLIGWSLGGVFAREVARDDPDTVQQVITMGSPIIGGPKYTSLARVYQRGDADLDAIERAIAAR